MDLSMFAQKKNKEVLPTNSLACQSSSLISNYSLYKLLIFSLNELTINVHKGGGGGCCRSGKILLLLFVLFLVVLLLVPWLFFCWFPGCSSAGSGSCYSAGYSCAGFSSALVFCYFLSPGRSCAVFNLASICFSFLCFWLINPTFWFHNLN